MTSETSDIQDSEETLPEYKEVNGKTLEDILHRSNPQDVADFIFSLTNKVPCAIMLNNVANDKDVKLQKLIKRLHSKSYAVYFR